MGPSTGLFDVGGQRLVTPPIRGRAGELKEIGALIAAVAQGRGGVLVIEGPPGMSAGSAREHVSGSPYSSNPLQVEP